MPGTTAVRDSPGLLFPLPDRSGDGCAEDGDRHPQEGAGVREESPMGKVSSVSDRLIRRTGVLVVALFAASGLMVAAAPAPVSADARGCTAAPGGALAVNCIVVKGSGLKVKRSKSSYTAGVGLPNICSRNHQWRYVKKGTSRKVTKTIRPHGCSLAVSYAVWKKIDQRVGKMKHNSKFCARSKNNQTGGRWTPYACVTIKRN
jgi:hypothetical protein